MLTGAWTTALVIVGGIEINPFGTRITSHDGRRTLLYTSLLLSGYILAGGTFGLFRQLGRGIRSEVTRASLGDAQTGPLLASASTCIDRNL